MELMINKEFRDLIPGLSVEEYQGLERSILKEGIREPICVWNGTIVDGHNRYSIAQRHDLNFQIAEQEFDSEADVKIWILSNQLSRRNITLFVRAELDLALEDLHRVRLKAKKDAAAASLVDSPLPEISKDTREEIAKAAGVSHGYIHTVSRIKNSNKVDADTMRKLRRGEVTAGKILKEIKKEERVEKAAELMKEAAQYYKPDESLQIVHAEFYQWCNENLEDGSVDLILTDPPYPKEYLHVWEQLSEVASRVLKFGGYLATYSGQMYLDFVMNALSTHLSYVWTVGVQHTGSTQYVNPRGLVCCWKPILIYKNGKAGALPKDSGSSLVDFIDDDYREKGYHEWGQGESAVGYLMKILSHPGDMVLDPFVGGGTTLAVAKDMKRRCIGIEIDKKYINVIKANIMKNDTKEIL